MKLAPILVEDYLRYINSLQKQGELNTGLSTEFAAYLIQYCTRSYYYKKGFLFYLYWKLNPKFSIKRIFKLDHLELVALTNKAKEINGFDDKKKVETAQ